GLQVTTIGTNAQIESMAIDSSGKVIAVGQATVSGRLDIVMVRYSATGVVDSTFGTSGTVTAALGSSCNADSVTIDGAGKIMIAGEEVSSGQQVMMVARYTSGGVLDTTFNTTGVQSAAIGTGSSNASAVAIDGSNRIVIAGGGSSFAMVRYLSTGAIDPAFGTAGVVNTAVGSGAAAIENLTFDGSGRIVVAGFSTVSSTAIITAARYASSGTLDPTFGAAGIATSKLAASAAAGKVTIDGSSHVLAAGISGTNFELARYAPNVSDVTVAEDTTIVAAATATDPDAGATLTYALAGGSDAAKFAIDPTTGILRFLTPPDFETPTDSNADNIYNVTEQVSDGSLTATQSVSVTVTNVTTSSATVYVNAAWASLASGTVIADADPTVAGNQPATVGVTAFGNLQGGAEAVTASGIVVLMPGTYSQAATFSSAFSLSVPTGAATVTAAISGSAGLTRIGTGTLTLTAPNAYTGGTTVSAGKLLVDGSIASSSGVSVAAAATLGGTGSLGNSVNSSGIIAPGDAAPGTLSATFLSLGSGTLALDLASSTSYDRLAGSFINITGTTLSLNLGTINDFDMYTILSVAGTSGGLTGTFVNLPTSGSTLAIGSRAFRINYAGGDGNDVVLNALSNASLSVVSTRLNGGISYVNSTLAAHQHSMVENVVYSFSQAINLTAANFALTGFQGTPASLVPNVNVSGSGTVWTVTFSGVGVNGGTHSIGDGEYRLVLSGIPGGPTNTFDFFRLLGDMDGSGTVDTTDFATLISTFLRATSDPLYLGADDFDGDGTIGTTDFAQFSSNFLKSVPQPLPN
ncbi:MAG TPA: autotransporter-associated beta strand repeat-containing protein, partial [Gemmataceae bacterium]|nr:autotransporter-associated beta strand repeat-containing protein [Gemmataceae bacterium]